MCHHDLERGGRIKSTGTRFTFRWRQSSQSSGCLISDNAYHTRLPAPQNGNFGDVSVKLDVHPLPADATNRNPWKHLADG